LWIWQRWICAASPERIAEGLAQPTADVAHAQHSPVEPGALELAEGDPTPAIGAADHSCVHQFEHRALAEGVRDDLGAPAGFDEEALEEIRGPE
jgi:hypothetical protein